MGITFNQLVDLLPRGDALQSKRPPNGLSYVRSPNPCFVEPGLDVEQAIEPGRTSVILLSAPGAVGKSTLAAELALRTGATLWDLSKVQVGSRTFAGTIMEAYDFEATGVLKRLQSGEFLFILDALDETQVRAGSHNFDAFLEDLAKALKAPRAKPTVVLLARSDTADWIHLFLDDFGVPLARYQIALFDYAQAVSFLEKRLDARGTADGGQLVHRQQAKPYTEARTLLFELIYELFAVSADQAWDDSRVRNFLGYAPVLEALTDYLDVSNYMTLVQELKGGAGAVNDPWEFLTDITNRLLKREESKVQSAVRPKLAAAAEKAGWADWHRLYKPEEQYARVLGQLLDSFDPSVETTLPMTLANEYEETIKTIVPQHPFLSGRRFANVVFKELAYAWGIIRGGDALTAALRVLIRNRETPFLPSQLFSRFVTSLAINKEAILDGQDFGVFYESLLSREAGASLSFLQTDDVVQSSITLVLEDDGEVEVQILDTGSGIHFWRRLANADIDVAAGIRLGLPHQRFVLGPDVDLHCDRLDVECENLEINVAQNVTIHAGSYTAAFHPVKLKIRNESRGRLAVTWPNLAHPWASYRAAEFQAPVRLSETIRGDTLRKFIMMFRRQRTRKERTLLSARWSPEQLSDRDELIKLALRSGVLQKVGPHQDILQFNNDYDSLRALVGGESLELSPLVFAFISEYLGKDQASRVVGEAEP